MIEKNEYIFEICIENCIEKCNLGRTLVRNCVTVRRNSSVYNHFNKWSVTKSGIFPNIALSVTFFYLNKYRLLWIFNPKWGIWNPSTSNADVMWASFLFLHFLNIFWIFLWSILKIKPNHSNPLEKPRRKTPHINIYKNVGTEL